MADPDPIGALIAAYTSGSGSSGGGGGGRAPSPLQRFTAGDGSTWIFDPNTGSSYPDPTVPGPAAKAGPPVPGAGFQQSTAVWVEDGPHGGMYYDPSSGAYWYNGQYFDSASSAYAVLNSDRSATATARPPTVNLGTITDGSGNAWNRDPTTGALTPVLLPDGTQLNTTKTAASQATGTGPVTLTGSARPGSTGGGGSALTSSTNMALQSVQAQQAAAQAASDQAFQLQMQQNQIAAQAALQNQSLDFQRQQAAAAQAEQNKTDALDAASKYSQLLGGYDINALPAFLQAGGGNIMNALAGGATALTDAANTPAAIALQLARQAGYTGDVSNPYNTLGPTPQGGDVALPPGSAGIPSGGSDGGTATPPVVAPPATDPNATPLWQQYAAALGINGQANPNDAMVRQWTTNADGSKPATLKPGDAYYDGGQYYWIDAHGVPQLSSIYGQGYEPAGDTDAMGNPIERTYGTASNPAQGGVGWGEPAAPWVNYTPSPAERLAMTSPSFATRGGGSTAPGSGINQQLRDPNGNPVPVPTGTTGLGVVGNPYILGAMPSTLPAPVTSGTPGAPGSLSPVGPGGIARSVVAGGGGSVGAFARGGMFKGVGVVGERGPELVVAPAGAVVLNGEQIHANPYAQMLFARASHHDQGGNIDPNTTTPAPAASQWGPAPAAPAPAPTSTVASQWSNPYGSPNYMAPQQPSTPPMTTQPIAAVQAPSTDTAKPVVPGQQAPGPAYSSEPPGFAQPIAQAPATDTAKPVVAGQQPAGPAYSLPSVAQTPAQAAINNGGVAPAGGTIYTPPATVTPVSPGAVAGAQPSPALTGGNTSTQPATGSSSGNPYLDMVSNFRTNASTWGLNPYDQSYWALTPFEQQADATAIQTKYGIPADLYLQQAQQYRLNGPQRTAVYQGY